jgi:tetratricopeptide (TPR) repeat protein
MRKLRFGFLVSAAAFLITASLVSAETNTSPPESKSSAGEDTALARHAAAPYEELQQEQQATLRAVENMCADAEAAAKRNTEALDARLKQLEGAVAAQREHELETLRSTNQSTLIIVALFAGVGFCGMLIIALFLLRALSRRAELGVAQPMGAPLGLGYPAAALGTGATQLVAVDPAQQVSARFLSTIERLEKRINQLENAAEASEPDIESKIAVAKAQPEPSNPAPAAETVSPAAPHPNADRAARVALLLGKGQSLLHLQQTDTALACFDEVIAVDPTNAEAFVKKGAALEKLGKLDEAIDCYDRAIAVDTSMTMAYLCKGGVFNRLERYGEALQCYEQALRAQQKVNVP